MKRGMLGCCLPQNGRYPEGTKASEAAEVETLTKPDLGAHHAQRRGYMRIVAALGIGLVLSLVVPVALVAEVADVGRSSAWVLTLLIVVWSGARLSIAIVSGKPMLFDFFFWVFCYVFMGIAPSVQIRSGLISTTTQGMDPALDVPTALLVCAGILCYEGGRVAAIWREHARRARHETVSVTRAAAGPDGRGVSRWRTVLLVVFGFAASAYFVAKLGLGSLFVDRYTFEAIRTAVWPDPATGAVVRALSVYPLLVAIGALALLWRTARRGRTLFAMAALLCTALLLVIVNPISSARYTLGTVLFAIVVYAGAVATEHRTRITLVATIAGFIFIFPIADAFRIAGGMNVARTSFFGEYMGNADYDAFWQIANAYSYVLDGLVQFGQQALGSLFFWVPRAIWPDKPVDTGILLAQYRGYSFDNLSAPLWAEFLVNGGIPFLVCGFLLVGYVLRVMDRKLLPAFAQARFWAIVGAIFPVYMTILLRGSLLQATGAVFVAVACLLFVRQWGPPRTAGPTGSRGALQLAEPLGEQKHHDHEAGQQQ